MPIKFPNSDPDQEAPMCTTVPGAAPDANIDGGRSSRTSIDSGPLKITRNPEAVAVAVLQRRHGDTGPSAYRWALTNLGLGDLGAAAATSAGPDDIAQVQAKGRKVTDCDLAIPAEDRRSVTFYRSSTWPGREPEPCQPSAEDVEWARGFVAHLAADNDTLAGLTLMVCGALQTAVHAAVTATTERKRLHALARAAAISAAYDEHAAGRLGGRQPNPGVVTELDGRDHPTRRRAPRRGGGVPAGADSPAGLEGARPGPDSGAQRGGVAVDGGHTTDQTSVVVLSRRGAPGTAAAHTTQVGRR